MAVRIEYLLVAIIGVLIVSILGINPSSKEAKSANTEREFLFKNASLSEVKIEEKIQKIYASKMVKYTNYLEVEDINISGENGYRVWGKRAIYGDDTVTITKGARVLREDGLTLESDNINYFIKREEIEIPNTFLLELNASTIKGEQLKLNIKSRRISAENVEASIFY